MIEELSKQTNTIWNICKILEQTQFGVNRAWLNERDQQHISRCPPLSACLDYFLPRLQYKNGRKAGPYNFFRQTRIINQNKQACQEEEDIESE